MRASLSLPLMMWVALREKAPNVLSHCHTKRRMDAHGHVHFSFGMTPTSPKEKNQQKKIAKINPKKSVSYQKKDVRGHVRPSFLYDTDSSL